jgi:hypothetical protein
VATKGRRSARIYAPVHDKAVTITTGSERHASVDSCLCSIRRACGFAALGAAQAATIAWTNWTAVDAVAGTATGVLDVNGTPVTVTYSGPAYAFGQTGVGTNYFAPNTPYLSALVENSPPAAEMLALNLGGTVTISFSQPIEDFFIALVNWNGNTVDFNTEIEIVSFGAGFWGNGTPILNAEGDGFSVRAKCTA